MNPLLVNILLALTWGLMTANMSAGNLAVGFLLGYAILFLQQGRENRSSYFAKVIRVATFSAYFLAEMIRSSLRVAYDAITPTFLAQPAILAVPLDAESDVEIALLANIVSLTPGTLALEVSADRKTMYVHAMYGEDPDAVRRAIKEKLERRLLGILR